MSFDYPDALNEVALKSLYSSDPVARSVLDEFAARQRNQRKTRLEQLLLRLGNSGKAAAKPDVINVLRKLEECGCGTFIAGRRGHPTRFEWHYDLVGVGKVAAGDYDDVEEIKPMDDDENTNDGESGLGDDSIEHTFQLRPGWQVSLVLPIDFTAREAARFSEFIKTLPFEAPTA